MNGQVQRTRFRRSFLHSVRFALDGVSYAIVSERNMRIHTGAACAVILFELIVRPVLFVAVWGLFTCFCVISAELINTSLERVTDILMDGQEHRTAKVIKDTAAGGVLMISIASLAVAAYIVIQTYPWSFQLFTGVHLAPAILNLLGLCTLLILVCRAVVWRKRQEQSQLGVTME